MGSRPTSSVTAPQIASAAGVNLSLTVNAAGDTATLRVDPNIRTNSTTKVVAHTASLIRVGFNPTTETQGRAR